MSGKHNAAVVLGLCGGPREAQAEDRSAAGSVGRGRFPADASVLETYVSYLRHKIDAVDPPLIHTVRGVGYTLRLPPERG